VTERILTTLELNRAMLARQLLLERSTMPLTRALEQVAGLQTQYAPSAYISLWSRLEGFERRTLTRALERRRAVQGTLMRSTIHIVSARDYWPFAEGIGPSRERWWLRAHRREVGEDADLATVAGALRAKLAGRVWHRDELDALLRAHASTIWSGAWVPMVRVPPSDADEEGGLEQLLRRYLGAFGPARLAEAADWAGVPVTSAFEPHPAP